VDGTVHVRTHELDELLTEHRMSLYRVDDAVDREPLPERGRELGGRTDSEVGRDERGLEVVPGRLVDPVTESRSARPRARTF